MNQETTIQNNNIFKEDNFAKITRQPCYFGKENKKLLGWLHTSDVSVPLDTCLVICPPLAVEYMSTYRSLRYVADYFALAGIPVMRFDYHGTGDSSGFNLDGNRLPDWINSIEECYQQVKALTGCSKVGLLGLRIGATFAALAAEKLELEFMILWASLDLGKRFVREIRAVQLTGAIEIDPQEQELLEAGGTVYWQETEQAIAKINLLKTSPKSKRTLLIPRDNFTPNTKLLDQWQTQGINVEQIELKGSSDMLIDAYFTIVPHKSIEKIVKWVTGGSIQNIEPTKRIENQKFQESCSILVPASAPSSAHDENFDIEESFFRFGKDDVRFGIASIAHEKYNPALPKIIIVNSGATHRVGPSRLHVLLARQLCGHGFQVFRIDIPGLGDSIINERELEHDEYIETSSKEILSAIQKIEEKSPNSRYVVTGLCSGAYFSFHAAIDLVEANIIESLLINPLTFYWEKGMSFETTPARNFSAWNWYRQALTSSESWKKLFSGKVEYGYLFRTIYDRIKIKLLSRTKNIRTKIIPKNTDIAKNDLDADLLKITENNTQLTFLLSKNDPGYDLLMTSAGSTAKKLIKKKKIKLFFIDKADHTFSKFNPRREAIKTLVTHLKDDYCE